MTEMDAIVWPDGTISRAWFDDARLFRFMLERDFRPTAFDALAFPERQELSGAVAFILLNPSTADTHIDDATIRRCSAFAKRWGKKRLIVVNLFPFRATNPKELLHVALDDWRTENEHFIQRAVTDSALVIAAWGVHGALRDRGRDIRRQLEDAGVPLYHLGLTKDGHPKHSLYQRADTEPQEWKR